MLGAKGKPQRIKQMFGTNDMMLLDNKEKELLYYYFCSHLLFQKE